MSTTIDDPTRLGYLSEPPSIVRFISLTLPQAHQEREIAVVLPTCDIYPVFRHCSSAPVRGLASLHFLHRQLSPFTVSGGITHERALRLAALLPCAPRRLPPHYIYGPHIYPSAIGVHFQPRVPQEGDRPCTYQEAFRSPSLVLLPFAPGTDGACIYAENAAL